MYCVLHVGEKVMYRMVPSDQRQLSVRVNVLSQLVTHSVVSLPLILSVMCDVLIIVM